MLMLTAIILIAMMVTIKTILPNTANTIPMVPK